MNILNIKKPLAPLLDYTREHYLYIWENSIPDHILDINVFILIEKDKQPLPLWPDAYYYTADDEMVFGEAILVINADMTDQFTGRR